MSAVVTQIENINDGAAIIQDVGAEGIGQV